MGYQLLDDWMISSSFYQLRDRTTIGNGEKNALINKMIWRSLNTQSILFLWRKGNRKLPGLYRHKKFWFPDLKFAIAAWLRLVWQACFKDILLQMKRMFHCHIASWMDWARVMVESKKNMATLGFSCLLRCQQLKASTKLAARLWIWAIQDFHKNCPLKS